MDLNEFGLGVGFQRLVSVSLEGVGNTIFSVPMSGNV